MSYYGVFLLVLLVVDKIREVLDMKDYLTNLALRTAGTSSELIPLALRKICYDLI